jgi:hypothetical protein
MTWIRIVQAAVDPNCTLLEEDNRATNLIGRNKWEVSDSAISPFTMFSLKNCVIHALRVTDAAIRSRKLGLVISSRFKYVKISERTSGSGPVLGRGILVVDRIVSIDCKNSGKQGSLSCDRRESFVNSKSEINWRTTAATISGDPWLSRIDWQIGESTPDMTPAVRLSFLGISVRRLKKFGEID